MNVARIKNSFAVASVLRVRRTLSHGENDEGTWVPRTKGLNYLRFLVARRYLEAVFEA